MRFLSLAKPPIWYAEQLNAVDFRGVVRTLIAAGLAWLIASLLGMKQVHWAVISALVVAQGTFGSTLRAGRNRILATCFGAAMGAIGGAAHKHGVPTPLLLLLALFPSVALASWRSDFRTAPVAAIIVISSIDAHGSPLAAALLRLAEIFVGALVGIVVSRWLFRTPTRQHMLRAAANLLKLLIPLAGRIGKPPINKTTDADAMGDAIRASLREIVVTARDARHDGSKAHTEAQHIATVLRRLYDDLVLVMRVAATARRKTASLERVVAQLAAVLQKDIEATRLQLTLKEAPAGKWEIDTPIETLAQLTALPFAQQPEHDINIVLRFALLSIKRNLEEINRMADAEYWTAGDANAEAKRTG